MTSFSHEQSAVFNDIRFACMKRGEIAEEIREYQADMKDRQENVLKFSDNLGNMLGCVEKKYSNVVREEEVLVQKYAEVVHEEEVLAQEYAEVVREEEVLAQKHAEVVREEEVLAQKRSGIVHEQEAKAQERVAIVRKQEETLQKHAGILSEQMATVQKNAEVVHEQEAVLKVCNTIANLTTQDARLQTDVLNSLDLLDTDGALKPVLVQFDSVSQTLFWGKGKSVQLTDLQYAIVDILYHAPGWQMSITCLEERAWGKDELPSAPAAKMAISRLNSVFDDADFPLEVIRTKRELKTVPIENPSTKILMDVIVQPEIELYELVRR